MQFEFIQILGIGQRNHTCIVWTWRKFGEIDSVFVAQEELYSPDTITRQSFGNLGRHLLGLSQVFRRNMSRLETFAVISTFLYVTDRRTEQGRSVLLGNSQQRDFAIEMNELFDDEFLDVTTATAATIFPRMFQVFRTLGYRLSLTG